MHVLTDKWSNDFLDYHRGERESRVRVEVWMPMLRVKDQYFERPRKLSILINYIRHVGLRVAIAKSLSRLGEGHRNDKYIAVGLGIIEQEAASSRFRSGDRVAFFAYNHPRCVERIVLDDRFMIPFSDEISNQNSGRVCLVEGVEFDLTRTPAFKSLQGWSSFSGIDVDELALKADLESVEEHLRHPVGHTKFLPVSNPSVQESTSGGTPRATGLSAAVCGTGNYARVCIMPHIDKRISVEKVFDIDPIALRSVESSRYACDTSSIPRADDEFDVYFVAGYHHTHAGIAVDALERGSYAVVEKPLATTVSDFERLEKANSIYPNRLFAGFHKRYLPMNHWAVQDLQHKTGDPIDYHCLVFEVPIPEYHWYLWPNSRGKLVSNGCHWIDHFLFLNDFCPIRTQSVTQLANGSVLVALSLDNDAVFTMSLTNIGSTIYGKRDHIELRVPGRAVRMVDEKKYEAESDSRLLRRREINPFSVYKRMYAEITRRIVDGESGETRHSLSSTRVTVELEDELAEARETMQRASPLDQVALHR